MALTHFRIRRGGDAFPPYAVRCTQTRPDPAPRGVTAGLGRVLSAALAS